MKLKNTLMKIQAFKEIIYLLKQILKILKMKNFKTLLSVRWGLLDSSNEI